MLVELGAYTILTDASPGLWHIPAAAWDPDAATRPGTLCGLNGLVYTYRGSTRTPSGDI